MATNLALDNSLLDLALQVGGYKSKKDTVNAALKEFIEKH
ncbi:MAG: type II toxin-antitoxin system VapB family antitoxin, partial [Methylococcales bacterium]|nr:type II toxin-antitoxin system VapB family antitoxin [Methylococcales bacterium]